MKRQGATILVVGMSLTACAPVTNPTPPLQQDAAESWVAWQNYSDQSYALTMSRPDEMGWALVEPCSADAMSLEIAEPFTVGLASSGPSESDPGRPIADSTDVGEAEPGFLVVVIDPNGEVTLETTEEIQSEHGICP